MRTRFELAADGAGFRVGARWLLHDISVRIGPGEVLGLIGPNGAGKSTLARVLAGILSPTVGSVTFTIDGHLVGRVAARHLAFVQQAVPQAPGFTAEEVVAMGRYPHRGPFERESDSDRRAVAWAMAWMGVLALANRRFDTLSGGERQRVMVARALAQSQSVIVLDEPAASLDIRYQLELYTLLRRLAAEGMAFAVVLHDLEAAARWCDRLLLLDGGRMAALGKPRDVLQKRLLETAYGVEVEVAWDVGERCRVEFALPIETSSIHGEAARGRL